MLIDMYLPKFDIYQNTELPNSFKNHANSQTIDVLIYFRKNFFLMSDVRSEIHLVRQNIISAGQSV